MIYTVKCDGQMLYSPYMVDRVLGDSELSLSVNEAGSFEFVIYDDHPLYNSIVVKQSRIKVYKDTKLIWLGRPSEITDDLDGARTVYCEGCLSYFSDSVLSPYDFSGRVQDFFSLVVNGHNARVGEAQNFILGNCTVTDPNDYIKRSSVNYDKTDKAIKEKMLDTLGGYLVVTFDSNENPVINWLAEISETCTQNISLGKNLVEFERSIIYSEFYTACIPLGAKSADGSRLTIEDINDGAPYLINKTLADTYGVIYADTSLTTWDDVTVAANLRTKGINWLADVGVKYKKKVELTAEDISHLDSNIESFDFLENVVFETSSGDVVTYLLAEFSCDIRDPYSLEVVLSNESYEYANSSLSQIDRRRNDDNVRRIGVIESDYVTNAEAKAVANEEIQNSTYIKQSAETIILQALSEYTKTSDFEELTSTIRSRLALLANEVSIGFNSTTTELNRVSGEVSSGFDNIYSFIRFLAEQQEGGVVTTESGVVIGKSTSDIKLKLQNNVLYFFTGDEKIVSEYNAIAWFSSNQLFVNNSTIKNLTLGSVGAYLDARIVGTGDNICVLWSGRI